MKGLDVKCSFFVHTMRSRKYPNLTRQMLIKIYLNNVTYLLPFLNTSVWFSIKICLKIVEYFSKTIELTEKFLSNCSTFLFNTGPYLPISNHFLTFWKKCSKLKSELNINKKLIILVHDQRLRKNNSCIEKKKLHKHNFCFQNNYWILTIHTSNWLKTRALIKEHCFWLTAPCY